MSQERRILRVLAVDDDPDMAWSSAQLCTLWGYEARICTNPPDCEQMAYSFMPDVIFLDLGMPGIDGYQMVRSLRRLPELAHTCFIAVTGYGGQEYEQESRQAGFAFHLLKPVEPRALRNILNDVSLGRCGQ